MADLGTLKSLVADHLARFVERTVLACNEITLEVPAQHLREVCFILRDAPHFDFKMLIDVCGIDYLQYGIAEWETESTTATGFSRGVDRTLENPPVVKAKPFIKEIEHVSPSELGGIAKEAKRFASVYHLLSITNNHRIRIRVVLDNDLKVSSVSDIWPAANWFEREAFDLFGIVYEGHPDLRRLLTDYGFVGHPFRKDFPLIGNVEARYDAREQRVVYEAVSIKPRILEPKVIREDNRYKVGDIK